MTIKEDMARLRRENSALKARIYGMALHIKTQTEELRQLRGEFEVNVTGDPPEYTKAAFVIISADDLIEINAYLPPELRED